jgi:hypothetical protein
MSDNVHFQYVPNTKDHFQAAPTMNIAQTAAKMDIGPTGAKMGVDPTADKMGHKKEATVTRSIELSQQVSKTAPVTDVEENKSSGLSHYNKIFIKLKSHVFENSIDHTLMVLLPNISKGKHSASTNIVFVVPLNKEGGVVIPLLSPPRDESEDSYIKALVENMSKKSTRKIKTDNEHQMRTGKAVIRNLVWEKAVNTASNSNVGVKFHTSKEDAKKLHQVKYMHMDGNTTNYQIVVPPAMANTISSDASFNKGQLLTKTFSGDTDPFVSNANESDLEERIPNSDNRNMISIEVDSLEMLWGLANMPELFNEYISKISNVSGRGHDVGEQEINADDGVTSQVITKMLEIQDNPNLFTGEQMSEYMDVLTSLGTSPIIHHWRVDQRTMKYQIPKTFYDIMHARWVSQVRKHEVFNTGNELKVSADSLPLAEGVAEESGSLVLHVSIEYYYSRIAHCYMN